MCFKPRDLIQNLHQERFIFPLEIRYARFLQQCQFCNLNFFNRHLIEPFTVFYDSTVMAAQRFTGSIFLTVMVAMPLQPWTPAEVACQHTTSTPTTTDSTITHTYSRKLQNNLYSAILIFYILCLFLGVVSGSMAGQKRDSRQLTRDKLETVMQTNYFGPFLLTNLLKVSFFSLYSWCQIFSWHLIRP